MTLTLDFVCVFDFNAFEATAQVTGGDTHTAVTVLLLTWTVFILDVNSKQKKLFSQIVNKPEHCLHYLLGLLTAKEQSVTVVSNLPTNCRAYLQRLTD